MSLSEQAYRDAPLLLNLERDRGAWVASSTWCNLGLWPQASFREACVALARLLGRAVALAPTDFVLDCGVGYGDQLELWCSEFGLRRLVALELSSKLVERARGRLTSLADGCSVTVIAGSAAPMPAEALAAAAGCDAVLCLDCAYHFDTRASFLHSAAAVLRRGGRYGAVDMVPRHVAAWGWKPIAQRVVAAACGIPRANLHSAEAYIDALHAAGFEDVRLEPISERVFAPFALNAVEQRQRLHGVLSRGEWIFLWATAAVMRFIDRHRLFDAVLVTARRS